LLKSLWFEKLLDLRRIVVKLYCLITMNLTDINIYWHRMQNTITPFLFCYTLTFLKSKCQEDIQKCKIMSLQLYNI